MIIDWNRYNLLPPRYSIALWLSHCSKWLQEIVVDVIMITISTS